MLYVQERLGRNGRPFRFYKFRSMRHDADDAIHRQFAAMFINGDNDGCHECNGGKELFKLEQDPRITRVGRILRRLSLDELPQLFHVLTGDTDGTRRRIEHQIAMLDERRRPPSPSAGNRAQTGHHSVRDLR